MVVKLLLSEKFDPLLLANDSPVARLSSKFQIVFFCPSWSVLTPPQWGDSFQTGVSMTCPQMWLYRWGFSCWCLMFWLASWIFLLPPVWFWNKSLWQKIFRSWFALVWSDSDMRGGRVFHSRILCCCSVQTLFWLFTAHPIVQWAFSPAVLTGGSSCLWGKNGQTCRGHTGDP